MAVVTNKHAEDINRVMTTVADFAPKQPTTYMFDKPTNATHPGNHQSGKGGPSDRNNNGVGDSEE